MINPQAQGRGGALHAWTSLGSCVGSSLRKKRIRSLTDFIQQERHSFSAKSLSTLSSISLRLATVLQNTLQATNKWPSGFASCCLLAWPSQARPRHGHAIGCVGSRSCFGIGPHAGRVLRVLAPAQSALALWVHVPRVDCYGGPAHVRAFGVVARSALG